MSEITMMVLEILISVGIAIAIRYTVPYIKAVTENEKYSILTDVVAIAVKAAEQTIRESGQGKVKKAQVIAFVSHWLTERNIHITEDMLDKLIESAVLSMKNELSR